VLKSGGCYTPEYVEILKAGVDANLSGHEFICLSDMDVPGKLPLERDLPGWYSKLEIFRLKGKVLYFDLDTIITGDLTDIASYPHRFTMLQDFMFPDQCASGVMAWDGDYSHIYENFDVSMIENYLKRPKFGDQGYISEQVKADTFQSLFPGQIMSRKMHRHRESARVVCYHGHPRPHQTGWAA
jgi:hypothetical protein